MSNQIELIKPNVNMGKSFFGIGVDHPKTDENIGTLIRSAKQFGASYVFTIGKRYKNQPSDVKLSSKIPVFYFETWECLKKSIPPSLLVGVELTSNSIDLNKYNFPRNSSINIVYILGNEDKGLSQQALEQCNDFIHIEGKFSLNVAVAGSIVLYKYFCFREDRDK